MSYTLRDYQEQAVSKMMESFETHKSNLVVMATGTGKTVVMAHVAGHFIDKGKILVLAHREELIFQAARTFEAVLGERAEIEMGDNWASHNMWGSRIICSTIQTQIAGKNGGRMTRFDPRDFAFVFVDECFVAQTLVDGKPIELYVPGDRVTSVSHASGEVRRNTVSRVYRRKPNRLVRIRFDDGRLMVATPNHPIFTLRGYLPAGLLTPDDAVLSINPSIGVINEDLRNLRGTVQEGAITDEVLLSSVRLGGNRPSPKVRGADLLHLRDGSCFVGTKWFGPREQGAGSVQQSVMQEYAQLSDNGSHQPQVCVSSHDRTQPHDSTRSQEEGRTDSAVHGLGSTCPRRQRKASYPSTNVPGDSVVLAYRSACPDIAAQGQRLSAVLQDGYSEPGPDGCGRGRWPFSRCPRTKSAGPQEGRAFTLARVDRVEVLEPGSDGRFGGLCPDGLVYNLEVERDNNYFASGVLVHNCHHGTADSYRRVIDHYCQNPLLRVGGCTATPDRADEAALGQVFEDVPFEFDILDGINSGWLVKPEVRSVYVEGLDYSAVRTTAGELNGADLAAVLEFEENLHGMTTPIIDLCGDKKTVIFTATVAQAERMAEILNRHKPGSADFVCGETPKEYRRHLFQRYESGAFQYLVNVGVLTEGWDSPTTEYAVLARPTKSRALCAQMIGRILRVLPGLVEDIATPEGRMAAIAASAKPCATIIDLVGNCGRHKLMHPTDVLGGKYNDEIVELAQRNIESGSTWHCEGCGCDYPENPVVCPACGERVFTEQKKSGKPADVASELVKAEREIDRRRRMRDEAAGRAHLKLRSQYTTSEIDPFDALDLVPCRIPGWHKGRPASDKQRAYIEKQGYNLPENLNFTHASQIISKIMATPSEKQKKILARSGFPVNVTRQQASAFIDQIVKNGWRPLPRRRKEELVQKVLGSEARQEAVA